MSSSGFLPGDLEHLVGRPLDDLRARVVRLVDAVAESHQPAFARLDPLDEAGNVLHAPISVSMRSTASFAPPCSGP